MKSERSEDTFQRIDDMYCDQLENWSLLKQNFRIYDNTSYEEIYFLKSSWKADKILLSYRKKSLSADLSGIANGERPCFLCKSARPVEQKSEEWKDYEVLANPYPASDRHLTIVCREHTPQRLGDRIKDLTELARILQDYAVFYNGPKCGASAPDHMHFQAVEIGEAENFRLNRDFMIECRKVGKSRIYVPLPNVTAFGYFILEVKTYADVIPMFKEVLKVLPEQGDEEPMMNVVAFRVSGATRVIIIPRKSHRPKCYGTSEGQILVSPASIEMMGKFITSRLEDFDRLDEQTMQEIYNDVAYTTDEFKEFIKLLV